LKILGNGNKKTISSFKLVDCQKERKKRKRLGEGQIYEPREKRMLMFGGIGVCGNVVNISIGTTAL